MNHLFIANLLAEMFGPNGYIAYWQLALIPVLIALVVVYFYVRGKGQ